MLEVFLVLIKILSIILNIVGVIIFYVTITDKKNYMYCLSPKWIYDNSKLNIFGTILLFLFLMLLIPTYYILWFIYWLCHVGRGDK